MIDRARNLWQWRTGGEAFKITRTGKSKILGRTGRSPIGITVDPYGSVYTTNDGSSTVSKIDSKGRSREIARTGERPIGIASDAAGFLYTANFVSNTVTEIYPGAKASPTYSHSTP